jgi:ubiquinol-cytochrome c reductase cytochrome b subunit
MKKVFPDHWSFMLGEIAMYSMIICLLTGAFLTFWFVPSAGHTVYDGSFVPLRGVGMSEAYASTLNISFDIKGGLLIRQIHHWAALMFIVALTVHMLRVFFTGAFRKPREINWVIGTVLSMLAIVEGFAGYSLPDDLLSGTGIRAMAEGSCRLAPVIGTYLVYGIFGGPFPGEMIIPRLYSVHILLLPAILIGCSRRTSVWSSCRSTPSTPARAARTRTSSASRSCRCTRRRPVASSSSSSVSWP